MDMNEVGEYLRASKDVLDILKTLGGLLPKGPDADAAQQRLEQAEKALKASEAQLAKALGYRLCLCTFPPQIMLWQQASQTIVCPNCGHTIDPNRRVAVDRGHSSWADTRGGR